MRQEKEQTTLRVFIASPGDCAEERRAFKEVIDELNKGFAAGADTHLEPLAWEEALSTVGPSPQSVINEQVDACDFFLLVLFRRWGRAAKDSPLSSYTEEEFHLALKRWKETGSPRVCVFLKKIDAALRADAGPQLAKVLKFRQELEDSNAVLYKEFEDAQEFHILLDSHLRAFVKKEFPTIDPSDRAVVLPIEAMERIEKAEKDAADCLKETEAARVEAAAANEAKEEAERELQKEVITRQQRDIHLASSAAKAAKEGRLEAARQVFAIVSDTTTDPSVLFLAGEFYHRTSEFDAAERLGRRLLSICGPDTESRETAAAYSNLGANFLKQRDWEQAEKMIQKALAIAEKIGVDYIIANACFNLGTLYMGRNEPTQAETLFIKARKINKRINCPKGLADVNSNLGIIYLNRDEVERAEKCFCDAKDDYERIGFHEGLAVIYNHLGRIHHRHNEWDLAEEMYYQSLGISEKLGLLECQANSYSYLGIICATRGKLVHAIDWHCKALNINEKIDRPAGVASDCGNLGVIYQTCGEWDRAEEFFLRAVDIYEKLGDEPKLALQYSNLGRIYLMRGEPDLAEEYLNKALAMYEKLGDEEGMTYQYANLGEIYLRRNKPVRARKLWIMARDLSKQIGIPHMVDKMQSLLDCLDNLE